MFRVWRNSRLRSRRNYLFVLGLFSGMVIWIFPVISRAQTVEQLDSVGKTAVAICRGGTLKGTQEGTIVNGDGGATAVLLLGMAKASVNGKVTFSKNEWDGISPLIPEHPDQSSWNACVLPLTNALLAKLDPSKSVQCEKIRKGLQDNSLKRATLQDAEDATSGEQETRIKSRIAALNSEDEATRKNFPECLNGETP
jgi:hypothetical protein